MIKERIVMIEGFEKTRSSFLFLLSKVKKYCGSRAGPMQAASIESAPLGLPKLVGDESDWKQSVQSAKAGVGNLSLVAGHKRTPQCVAGGTNFPPPIPFPLLFMLLKRGNSCIAVSLG